MQVHTVMINESVTDLMALSFPLIKKKCTVQEGLWHFLTDKTKTYVFCVIQEELPQTFLPSTVLHHTFPKVRTQTEFAWSVVPAPTWARELVWLAGEWRQDSPQWILEVHATHLCWRAEFFFFYKSLVNFEISWLTFRQTHNCNRNWKHLD